MLKLGPSLAEQHRMREFENRVLKRKYDIGEIK
jgi:hypothetical protein